MAWLLFVREICFRTLNHLKKKKEKKERLWNESPRTGNNNCFRTKSTIALIISSSGFTFVVNNTRCWTEIRATNSKPSPKTPFSGSIIIRSCRRFQVFTKTTSTPTISPSRSLSSVANNEEDRGFAAKQRKQRENCSDNDSLNNNFILFIARVSYARFTFLHERKSLD